MKIVLLILCLSLTACASHAPASLSPAGVWTWQADQAVVAIGEVQHVAIALNGIQLCDPAPCHPLFSNANTKQVVDAVADGITVIHAAPAGWKAAGLAALDRIDARIDLEGRLTLKAYTQAARNVIGQF